MIVETDNLVTARTAAGIVGVHETRIYYHEQLTRVEIDGRLFFLRDQVESLAKKYQETGTKGQKRLKSKEKKLFKKNIKTS